MPSGTQSGHNYSLSEVAWETKLPLTALIGKHMGTCITGNRSKVVIWGLSFTYMSRKSFRLPCSQCGVADDPTALGLGVIVGDLVLI